MARRGAGQARRPREPGRVRGGRGDPAQRGARPPARTDPARLMTRTAGSSRALALLLVITGAAGLLAAWVITIDKFKLLE
ncbi:hypothetical protein ACWDTN_42645, partial [Streptomyces sp. NPDC003483]